MPLLFSVVIIPNPNIITLLTVGFFCVFAPILLYLLLRKKLSLKILPFGVGAACYMVFVLLLENSIVDWVAGPDSAFHDAMIGNPALYMLFIGFTAGAIEESGRFLSFFALKKWYPSFSTAVSLALGFSSIESIFLIGVRYITYSFLAISHNMQVLAGKPSLDFPSLFFTLSSASPTEFVLAGLETVLLTGLHIGLAALVWYSVAKPGCTYLLYASILIHAIFKAPIALKTIHVISSVPLYYIVIAVCSLLSIAIAFFVYRADIRSRSKLADPYGIF